MKNLPVFLALVSVCFAADLSRGYTWHATPQPVELANGKVDLMFSGKLPEHWVVGVTEARGGAASITAGTIVLDGPFIDRVDTLDTERQPGVVRIGSVSGAPGVAVCVNVPAGAEVHVFSGGVLAGSARAGYQIVDGGIATRAKWCGAVPVLQQLVLGSR